MSILLISAKQLTKKLNAFSRINHYMKQNQKEIVSFFIILISVIVPLFGCFAPKNLLKKINEIYERSLWIIQNDYESPYSLLLQETHRITFHQWCINSLMIVVCKYLNGHSPGIMNIFNLRGNMYNLRNFTSSRHKIFVHWNTDSMLFHIVLANSGNKCVLISARQLKNRMKTWKCEDCPSRSWKIFKISSISD